MEADLTPGTGAPPGADDGAGGEEFSLPPAFDFEATKQAAYEAAMAEAEQPGDEGEETPTREPSPAEAKPAEQTPTEYEAERQKAVTGPLAKLTPEEQEAVKAALLSDYQAEQSRLKELQDKAAAAETAEKTLREQFGKWLAVDPSVKAEHDELKALVYSDDPNKWTTLRDKGHDLESAIARVAQLEAQIGERTERSAMSQAISNHERLQAWTAVDQVLRGTVKHEGITQELLEAGGEMGDLIDRAITAHGEAKAKAVKAEYEGKLAEQKAMYERRLTRAGSSEPAVVESGGRSAEPSGNFLASVSRNGQLLPGMVERAMRGEFANVPLSG